MNPTIFKKKYFSRTACTRAGKCWWCTTHDNLGLFYLDGNKANENPSNLLCMCKRCSGKHRVLEQFRWRKAVNWTKADEYELNEKLVRCGRLTRFEGRR